MKTKLLLLLLVSLTGIAQNSLMVSPQTGTMITTGSINHFKLISDGTSVALVAANNATGKVFIVDINDSNPADKVLNTIETTSTTVRNRIGAALGQSVTLIRNIEVNPITHSVYAMAIANNTPYIVKLTNACNTISVLNFNTMPFCSLNFTNPGCTFQDIAWGGNKLFVSSNHITLHGELGYITAPFTHNATITKRATTMFKSNWGGNYITNAPLEKMSYISIDDTDYLCGVTTCAPGFSETISSLISNSGLFTVRQSFDMFFDPSIKTVPMNNGNEAYLLNLHYNGFSNAHVYRIGKTFLNGTPLTNNTFNNNSIQLRTITGDVNPGLPNSAIAIFPGSFSSIAYYSPCELLTLSMDGQTLGKLTVCEAVLGVEEQAASALAVTLFPNPVKDLLNIQIDNTPFQEFDVAIYATEGRLVKKQTVQTSNSTLSIADLQVGSYILKVSHEGKQLYSKTFIKN